MKFCSISWSLLISFLAGCSTLSSNSDQPKISQLTLSQIEKLEFGKLSKEETGNRMGSPDQVVSLERNQELWVYNDPKDRNRRVTVLFGSLGQLETATWILRESDELTNLQDVLERYPGSRFTKREIGWTSNHSYSGDLHFENKANGISLYYLAGPKQLFSISFSAPKSEVAVKHVEESQ